jgi:hypothetical protein
MPCILTLAAGPRSTALADSLSIVYAVGCDEGRAGSLPTVGLILRVQFHPFGLIFFEHGVRDMSLS